MIDTAWYLMCRAFGRQLGVRLAQLRGLLRAIGREANHLLVALAPLLERGNRLVLARILRDGSVKAPREIGQLQSQRAD